MLNKPRKRLNKFHQPPTNSHDNTPQQRRVALYTVLAQIPSGAVTTYGQLAEFAGLGRAARWVGRTLSQLPEDSQLPWHRVIAAGGRLSLPVDSPSGRQQRQRLAAEGILLCNDRIDVQRYGWRPMEHSG